MDETRVTLDRTRQAAPQVIDFLRERILSLDLAPGTVLSRPALQQKFGLSQTPVRDALLKLEEEGLVTVYPQHATLVSRLDLDQARQAHFMRSAIETGLVRQLAQAPTGRLIADLSRANDDLAAVAAGDMPGSFLQLDRAFHQILFRHAGMEMLWPILRANSGHLDRLRRLNLASVGTGKVIDQHGALIAAIASGNPGRAAEVMEDHLRSALERLSVIAGQYPDLVLPGTASATR